MAHYRVKSFELIFEAYPQMIFGIFIMQDLQIMEWKNILSCSISTISVIFGFGDYLAYVANHNQAGAPKKLTLFGVLTTVSDSLFRALFLAYILIIFKMYALLIFPIYMTLMFIAICIIKICIRQKKNNGEIALKSNDVFGTVLSFACSAHEDINVEYTFRQGFSKKGFPQSFI